MKSNQTFHQAMAALHQANEAFANGSLSSVAHGNNRQAALCAGIVGMAETLGASIAQPVCIDSRGELSITGLRKGDKFGTRFAAWLNTANPRTGVAPGAIMLPESSWCRLNHFDAERLLCLFEKSLQESSNAESLLAAA